MKNARLMAKDNDEFILIFNSRQIEKNGVFGQNFFSSNGNNKTVKTIDF